MSFRRKERQSGCHQTTCRRGYINRQAFKVLNRAVLYNLSQYLELANHTGFLLVTKEDMETAIHNQEEYYKQWLKFLTDWKASKSTRSICVTDEADREYYMSALRRCLSTYDPVSKPKFLKVAHWNESSRHYIDTHKTLLE